MDLRDGWMSVLWAPGINKLVYVAAPATAHFWDERWRSVDWKREITRSRASNYWRLLTNKYLQPGASVLEGGCGTGHLVDALRFWGYRSSGVDFAESTIQKIQETDPSLPVRIADVRALDARDESFDGYFSLGVIEHFWDGHMPVLMELSRVLKKGGIGFITFPAISTADRIKIRLGGYSCVEDSSEPPGFYQFALDKDAVVADLDGIGLDVVEQLSRNGMKGLERVCRPLARIAAKNRYVERGVSKFIKGFCHHGVMLVVRKR